jgi:hypothetical protein
MPKLLTRLLLLTLSAFSFTVFSDFNENPQQDHVSPKISSDFTYLCISTWEDYGRGDAGRCISLISDFISSDPSLTHENDNGTSKYHSYKLVPNGPEFNVFATRESGGCSLRNGIRSCYPATTSVKVGRARNPLASTSETCPPDGFPKYTVGPNPINPDDPDSPKACFPRFKPCPLGFYAHAVTPSNGIEQCVPVNCPSKGSSVNNIKNFQNVLPVSGAGTFCDGLCSYSVEQGAISYQGQKFASGISNGAVCGQSPTDKNKFTPLQDDDSCEEHTLTNGATFQDCSDGVDDPVDEQPDPSPPVEDALVDEDIVVDPFTGVDCKVVDDKLSCVGENITDAITEQTKKQAKLDAEKHNKLVNQQKDISDYVENQANKRFEKQTDIGLMTIQSIDNVARTIGILGQGAGGDGTGNQAILDALGGIGDGLGETDTETDTIPSDGIESFYEAEYPNGFADVWSKNKALLYSSAPFEFVNQFSNIPTTGGTAPDMEFCFNLGENMNYGCDSITLDSRIFGFLYSIMMISAAFACRQIIFGG